MTHSPQTPRTTDPVISDQSGPHRHLAATVERHLRHPWRKPVPDHTREAATDTLAWLESLGSPPLILDSFCGTGLSTSRLAARFPDHAIIGIDKSAARLNRHVATGGRYRLVRAEAESFWRCLVDAGCRLDEHYILYPNPWPKSSQLQRRVHGHPAFPLLAELEGRVEVRSNWAIYIEEFAEAARKIGFNGSLDTLTVGEPLTLFERKYHDRGQTLWRYSGRIELT